VIEMGFLKSGKFILILGLILIIDAGSGLFFPLQYDVNTGMLVLLQESQSPILLLFGSLVIGLTLLIIGLTNFKKEF